MLTTILKTVYIRDLTILRKEISLYTNENSIWKTDKSISNSAGNLCLHLVGNLNTYIGAVLGNSGYIRNRDLEFSLKNVPRNELLSKIDKTIIVVENTLGQLQDTQLSTEYPVLVWEEKTSVAYLLIHLAAHLGYHLGQVNYHRRLLDNCTSPESAALLHGDYRAKG